MSEENKNLETAPTEEVKEEIKEEIKEETPQEPVPEVTEADLPKEMPKEPEPAKKEEKKGLFKKKDDEEKKKLQAEIDSLKDKYLRANAEMQNMRRRMEEEKANLLKYEGEDLIKKLLPIVDNFERAIQMDDTNLEDEVSKFLSGFKMIYGNLSDTLKGYEVEVMDILQKGYTYKGKVIRHAMVKVSK